MRTKHQLSWNKQDVAQKEG